MLWQRITGSAHRHDAQRSKVFIISPIWGPFASGPCAGSTAGNHICHLPFDEGSNGWKVGGAGARSRRRSGVRPVLCVVEKGGHGPVPSMPEILLRHSFHYYCCLTLSTLLCRAAVVVPLACGSACTPTLTPVFGISPNNQPITEHKHVEYTYSPSNVGRYCSNPSPHHTILPDLVGKGYRATKATNLAREKGPNLLA